jgi:hypothetical protein
LLKLRRSGSALSESLGINRRRRRNIRIMAFGFGMGITGGAINPAVSR